MTEEEQELRKAETWDVEQVVVNPAVQNRRTVVSVAFSRNGFERVANAAKRNDLKTSEFIRIAALEKAASTTRISTFGLAGASQWGSVVTTTYSLAIAGTSIQAPIHKSQDDALIPIGPTTDP